MRLAIIFAFFVAPFAVPSLASAQINGHERARIAPAHAAKTAGDYRAVQRLTYGDGDEIEVGPMQPTGDTIGGRTVRQRESLIRVRVDFRPELMASALSVP